jgi:hypothetical protein
VTDKERIIQFIEDTEYDRNYWFIKYTELRDLIVNYLDRLEESKDINQRAFEDAHKTVVDS